MSRSTRTLLVFSLSLVVAGVFSALVYQAGQRTPAAADVQSVPVAVAARALAVGSKLTAADVKLVQWPASSPIAGAITSVDAAVDRGRLANVAENEPLTAAKVAAAGAGAGLPPMIAPGMRAISVQVDDVVGVAGFIVAGAHVDAVVTITQRDQNMARVVVSNVEVLAAGTRAEQSQATDGRNASASVVTLLVTPADAERISLASSVGRITLTLRNPLYTAATDTRGTQLASLLGAPEPPPVAPAAPRPAATRVVRAAPEPAPAPPPPPPAPYTVETIRAAKRTAEVVK
ncbi:MAG: Flp pilus assembly protein CpaB [Acidobacteria bacterium]|nr:Flp pilus assembly protein CpaB [Acidobacteriota bacterium]